MTKQPYNNITNCQCVVRCKMYVRVQLLRFCITIEGNNVFESTISSVSVLGYSLSEIDHQYISSLQIEQTKQQYFAMTL